MTRPFLPPPARLGLLPRLGLLAAPLLALAAPAQAGLMLSKVILDLGPEAPARDDIELFNDDDERLYVVAEPSEILDPGMPTESPKASSDPSVTGLLVSPQKLVLEPGEHKLVRIAAVAARPERDRIYRVTIKPVAGPVSADRTALKLYVGYDALVIYRPQKPQGTVEGQRRGNQLAIRNTGNTNVELAQGRQCDAQGANCQELPANRIYPGAEWLVDTPYRTPVTYQLHSAGQQREVKF